MSNSDSIYIDDTYMGNYEDLVKSIRRIMEMKKLILTLMFLMVMSTASASGNPINVGHITLAEQGYTVYLMDNYIVNKDNYCQFRLMLQHDTKSIIIAMDITGDLEENNFINNAIYTFINGRLTKYEKAPPTVYKVNTDYMEKAFSIMRGE